MISIKVFWDERFQEIELFEEGHRSEGKRRNNFFALRIS